MRYWWLNQNQTYKHEVPGGFLWSPKVRSDGARHKFYDNSGNLLIAPELDRGVLAKWGISEMTNVGQFNAGQSGFLEYHRQSVFKSR